MTASQRAAVRSAVADYKREHEDAARRMVDLCKAGQRAEVRGAIARAVREARATLKETAAERARGLGRGRAAHVAYIEAIARWQLQQARTAGQRCR